MAFLGLMTVKEHEAVVAELRRQIAVQADNKRRMAESMESEARHLRRQLDKMYDSKAELLAELATLKSARERQLANLAKGSAASAAKRKAATQS